MSIKNAFLAITIALLSVWIISLSPHKAQDTYAQTSSTLTSGVSVTIEEETTGGGGNNNNPATINFSGFTSPDAIVTFLRNSSVIGTALSSSDGMFEKSATVSPGFITFGIRSRDAQGLRTQTSELTISVNGGGHINISNIFLSPTITADKFKLKQGGTLRIHGSTFQASIVRIFNNFTADETPIGEVVANTSGLWEYFFPTENLGEGEYSIKVNAQMETTHLVSPFSEDLEFTIAEIMCSGADFNLDTRVNIIDFSILIFYWEKNPALGNITNICTDLNTDEIVNIFDFSILMHEWTD